MKRAILAVFGIFAMAGAAQAGIADSPLPNIGGAMTFHLYSVPGVVNGPNLGTYFSCTSTSTAAALVSVELFNGGGGSPTNNAATDVISVPAGATVTLGTSNAAGLSVDKILGGGFFAKGSARILSSSKSLICSVFLSDTTTNPPTSMSNLTVVYKLKQKGQ